ncbi:hypothetical protein SUGI_0138450 [Cryptomeria japonica]|nr:hypothetical protein SUGI_0138450 [Cryptomeria japonica]
MMYTRLLKPTTSMALRIGLGVCFPIQYLDKKLEYVRLYDAFKLGVDGKDAQFFRKEVTRLIDSSLSFKSVESTHSSWESGNANSPQLKIPSGYSLKGKEQIRMDDGATT